MQEQQRQGERMAETMHQAMQQASECGVRPKIEIVRVPSTERASFRPLDGVQLRAAYSHVRVGTYCPEPPQTHNNNNNNNNRNSNNNNNNSSSNSKRSELKPPAIEQSTRKYKKNLGPVSRLLRRRHHATSLATKSCDNIYSVNKTNSFFEWKHGHNGHDQGRQSSSLDWRVGRSVRRNSGNLEYRKASRSAEQLSRSGTLQTPSTKSKIVSLLKRLSPRLPRPSSKNSLTSSPSVCPWVQVEYTNDPSTTLHQDCVDAAGDDPTLSLQQQQQQQQQESDHQSFQREIQLNELRKRAIKDSTRQQRQESDAKTATTKEKRSPQPNVRIREKQDSNPNLRA